MKKNITIQQAHYTREVVDTKTGEITVIEEPVEIRPVLEGTRNVTIRDKHYFGRDFLTMFKDDLYNLIVHGEIRGMELVVLMYLIATLDKDNATFTNLDIIATDLKVHRNNVSTYINKLIRRKLIIATKVQKRRGSGPQTLLLQIPIAQLNYNLVYNSQTKNYKEARAQHPEITQLDGVTLIDPEKEKKRIEEKNKREPMLPGLFNQQ